MLAGSGRPFIVTSGTAIAKVAPGELAIEDAPSISSKDFPRAVSEETTADLAANGVKTVRGSLAPGSRPGAAGAH